MNQWNNIKIRRKKAVTFSKIDDEVVLIHPEDGKYYSFNKVGSFIWEIIEDFRTYDDLVELLLKKYDVEEEQCKQEVSAFIELLYEKNLVDVEKN